MDRTHIKRPGASTMRPIVAQPFDSIGLSLTAPAFSGIISYTNAAILGYSFPLWGLILRQSPQGLSDDS
jgi:hypothetical protein